MSEIKTTPIVVRPYLVEQLTKVDCLGDSHGCSGCPLLLETILPKERVSVQCLKNLALFRQRELAEIYQSFDTSARDEE